MESSPENVKRVIDDLDLSNLALVDEGQLNQSYNPDLARDGGGYDQPWELYSDGRYEILSHDLNVGDFGIGDQHLTIYTDNIEVASAHYLDFGTEEWYDSEELKTIFWVRDILKNQLNRNDYSSIFNCFLYLCNNPNHHHKHQFVHFQVQ